MKIIFEKQSKYLLAVIRISIQVLALGALLFPVLCISADTTTVLINPESNPSIVVVGVKWIDGPKHTVEAIRAALADNEKMSGSGSSAMSDMGEKNPSRDELQAPASSDNTSPSGCAGDLNPVSLMPVIIATGEKVKFESDFAASSAYGLSHTRTYRSNDGASFALGPRWQTSLVHQKLLFSGCYSSPDYGCVPNSVTFTDVDGSRHIYTRTTNGSDGPVRYSVGGAAASGTIRYLPGVNWTLTIGASSYLYSAAGVIQSISRSGAEVRRYTYGGASIYQPTKISSATGQSVQLTWVNNRISEVSDPALGIWKYAYNSNGMLSRVTSPGANASARIYHYGDSTDNTLLTGISIQATPSSSAVRYSTYKYFSNRKVQESGLAAGEGRDTFTYGTQQTTMTSLAGQTTVYDFATVQSALKIKSISRQANNTCPAAAAKTYYDANGWVDYTLDWNGNKTDYEYDSAGRLLREVTAPGTAAARSRVLTWAGDDLTEVKILDAAGNAYRKTVYAYVPSSGGYAAGKVASETNTDLRTGAVRKVSYAYTFHANKVLATLTETLARPGTDAVTFYSYSTAGNLVLRRDALGKETIWSNHNGLGLARRVTDANGVSSDITYDAKGQLISVNRMLPTGSRLTTYAYNGDGQVTDVSYPTGRIDRFRYTAGGRLEQVGNALNEFVTLASSQADRTASTSSGRNLPGLSGNLPVATAAGSFSAGTRMDSLLRTVEQIGNDGQRWVLGYDKNGNLTSRTDAAGRTTLSLFDAANRLTRLTAPDGVSHATPTTPKATSPRSPTPEA
jgi:YD repeat-containing protein